jgi:hypothetical protein
MRVRSTYVVTPALLVAALGAPFALPRLLNGQGSAGLMLRAVSPPAAAPVVVQMAALPQPKRVSPARPTLVRATPRPAAAQAELASVRILPVRTAAVTHARPVRQHPPVPEESPRAPDPPPPAPTVVTLTPQPANLNSTDAAAAPAQTPPPPAQVPLQPAPPAHDGSGPDNHGHGNGNGNGVGNGHGNGHDH